MIGSSLKRNNFLSNTICIFIKNHLEMKYLVPLFSLIVLFSACKKKDTTEDQAAKDEVIITQYISDNNLNATATGSGLHVVINNPGTGASCNSNSNVKVSYKGYFTNGEVFDQSSVAGITFNLQNVIKGWTEGIPYFKEGGSGILLIPSALGYGANGNSSIPGNTVLIFEITLIDVI